MAPFNLSLLIFHALLISFSTGETSKLCEPSSCSSMDIKSPFSLQARCAFSPAFSLSCSENNRTIIELPNSVKLTVKYIDYEHKTIRVSEPTCLLSYFSNLNLSASPFKITTYGYYNISFFTCHNNSTTRESFSSTCLGGGQVYRAYSDDYIILASLLSCKKLYANSSLPFEMLWDPYELVLSWSKTDLGYVYNGVPKSRTAGIPLNP